MLGRFLEISVHTPDIRESLDFYESLGFVQAAVAETWTYPYAVVTDGRLYLGLHGSAIASPTLTYVQPNLLHHVQELRDLGIQLDLEQLSAEAFNRVTFRDPANLHVQVLEARTFSPPMIDAAATSACGYFAEFGVPCKDFVPSRNFWEPLGFVAWDEETAPFPHVSVTSNHFNLGLYKSRTLRTPTLTFQDSAMHSRIEQLLARGFSISDEMPDSLAAGDNGIVIAPEGTRLLLLHGEA